MKSILRYLPVFAVLPVCTYIAACSDIGLPSDKPQIIKTNIFHYRDKPTRAGAGRQDSVVIGIYVKAGIEDLGMDQPFDATVYERFLLKNDGWTNYKITILRLTEGKFKPVPPLVFRDIIFFPALNGTSSGRVKEGYLYFNRIFYYQKQIEMVPTKFQIQIRDNNLNESNIIETDTVVVPYFKN
jgi:hypothetical protein